MSPAPVRGIKYQCADCATRFYDLNKQPAACPKCGKKVPAAAKAPARRARRIDDSSTTTPANELTAHLVVSQEPKAKAKTVRWNKH
jgi:uncharacterized protein (TIGR02300 family)